jgi:hypothetical protein
MIPILLQDTSVCNEKIWKEQNYFVSLEYVAESLSYV